MGGLISDMTATPERTIAWIIRGVITMLLTVIGATVGLIGYLAKDAYHGAQNTLTRLEQKIDGQGKTLWPAIGENTKAISTLTSELSGLTTAVHDHLREDNRIQGELMQSRQDHDVRLRRLESGSRSGAAMNPESPY